MKLQNVRRGTVGPTKSYRFVIDRETDMTIDSVKATYRDFHGMTVSTSWVIDEALRRFGEQLVGVREAADV